MTIYAAEFAAGPGVHSDAGETAGALTEPYEYLHVARLPLPGNFNELSQWQEIAPGVQVQWATPTGGGDQKKAAAYRFDALRFGPDQARAWLAARNVLAFSFVEDARHRPPQTQGSPSDPGEEAPAGFASLAEFYSQTVPVDLDEDE